jgi:hypothetical protein
VDICLCLVIMLGYAATFYDAFRVKFAALFVCGSKIMLLVVSFRYA